MVYSFFLLMEKRNRKKIKSGSSKAEKARNRLKRENSLRSNSSRFFTSVTPFFFFASSEMTGFSLLMPHTAKEYPKTRAILEKPLKSEEAGNEKKGKLFERKRVLALPFIATER